MKSNLLDLLEISFGPKIMEYMKNDDVIEIMRNDDGTLFIDTLSQGMIFKGYMEAEKALNIIYLVANHSGQEATIENSIISAELPGSGFRFEGSIPPTTATAAFNIRKYSILELTLDDYVKDNIMTKTQAEIIKQAVAERKNILVVGGTGSGKTTLCNAILSEISKYDQRIIIIQDTNELKCSCEAENHFEDDRIYKAIKFIEKHQERIISLAEIAKVCFLSESRFLHLFKEKTGIQYRRYQLWNKLIKSLPYLKNHSITETAHRFGFADSSHYSRTFKETFGFTPKFISNLG